MEKYQFPTIQELLAAGVHFGHSVNKWNPKMEPYIFSSKQGVHIIDLDKTSELLKAAADFLYGVAAKGGQIIFVCTKKQIADLVAQEAKRCGGLYMSERWMRLERFFGGVVDLKGAPAAVLIVDAKREKTAINECKIFNVPVVGLVDTNSDPSNVDKLIPGNDDAAKSVGKLVAVLADCIAAGYREYEKSVEIAEAKEGASVEPSTVTTASEAVRLQVEPTDTNVEVDKVEAGRVEKKVKPVGKVKTVAKAKASPKAKKEKK
ncbi:MAG: Ribosomal protein S2 [candidate division WWE3 bacterium GW2011_GWA2_44_16]|uniref:Small ribosomal subunit protein uS2 n=1 Tax=candidate division WWE3 bacterium GW2011_GWA2_44_16 TaxID=1619110 RepID=A0A0G1HEX2_UNCKA|nr:MAG: Ribosomal protein S2 [candidate division WWE3 bacterium GW2011_GWA2_44_16]